MERNTTTHAPDAKSWGLIILLALIWGSSFILMKKGLLVFSSAEVGSIRIMMAALVLTPISIPRLRKINWRQLRLLLVSGSVGSFIPALLFAKAETNLDSGLAGVLNALTPLFVILVGILFFGHKLKWREGLGIALGFAGTSVLMLAGSGGDIGNVNLYALFILLATFCYGLNLNIVHQYFHKLRSLEITSLSLLLVSPMAIGYLFGASDFVDKMGHAPGAWWSFGAICILGIMGTAVALTLFNQLVKWTSPLFTSLVTYIIPIVAIGWGILDGEQILPGHFLGMCIIIIGVLFANTRKK